MNTSLDDEIRQIARRVRLTDFLWAAGLTGGACGIFAIIADTPHYQALLIWLVILAGLAVRYFTTNVNWSRPVRRVVAEQLALFRRLRTIMNALPEPVILLTADGRIELANPATGDYVKTAPEGMYLTEIFRAPVVARAIEDAINAGEARTADFTLPGTVDRFCRLYVTPLKSDGSDRAEDSAATEDRVLVFISDLSGERRLQKMRTDFIANASHELRTPLTSMLGFIETLRGHARDDEAAREKFLGIMQSQAERMLRLVRDLMSLSTIELNEHMPPRDSIDPVKIAEEAKVALAPVASDYHGRVRVVCTLEEGQRLIQGDRDEIYQIVQNLVDNALKYAGEDPQVEILIGHGEPPPPGPETARTGDTAPQIAARAGMKVADLVHLSVRDNGHGIARDDLPRLTERFYRVDVEQSRSRGGTGLGLAIVKHIIYRHDGGLQIESSSGNGAAFTCFFRPAGK